MFERFLALTAAQPDAVALIEGDSGRVTTRAELLDRAHEIGRQYAEGETIAVRLPNSVDFVATVVAAMQRNLVAILIDRDAPPSEVARIVEHFGLRTRAAALPPGARLIKLTSGSTGMPKGIVASEANLLADATNICATMDIRAEDVNFGAIPMSHSYGFSNLVMPLLTQGTAVVISNDYLPQSVLDLCNRYQCTVVPAIPMVFDHLASTAKGEFATVRTFLSAGAPLPESVSRRFRERFGKPIHTFYGCSECGGITYDLEGGSVERGTVGGPMEGVTLSVEQSRLVVCGANVALGYLHDATHFEPFAEGRFVADDLVDFTAAGEVVLTGRASELINTAGRKVNPREVEQVLLQMEGVQQAKAYGEPAGARGDVVAAAIVASSYITREQVREFCRAHLSPHKVPRIIKLIDSIPVDDRGKVRRSALAEL
ncbi:MAG: class I adenylate-forming enzyme family protein [Acidobacteriota bacterium]